MKTGFPVTIGLLTVLISGCASSPERQISDLGESKPVSIAFQDPCPVKVKTDESSELAASKASETILVAHEQTEELPFAEYDIPLFPVSGTSESHQQTSLSLSDLETLAQANNPTLIQSAAQVEASRGAAYQAGLYPNPVVGYASDQIGIDGTAGELQGAFVSQEFVTGGKLKLSRAKWTQQICIAETNLSAQYTRVLNDVRVHFYRTLAAQQMLSVHNQLLSNAQDNLQTHKEMLNLGQTNQAGLLQAEIDLHRARLKKMAAENNLEQEWRDLVAMVGTPELQCTTLKGSLEPATEVYDWSSAMHQLLENSPEIVAAWERVQHDEITVERERVQPIPNILVNVDFGHNFETNNNVAGVTAGLPLPVFDRNQGTVDQALADLNQSRANVKRLELSLMSKLSDKYRDYRTARQHVETYRSEMLPKAKEAYDLLHESYKRRRAPWPEVLMAQKIYYDLQAEYIMSQLQYHESEIAIRGMLLTGGLEVPSAPMSGGHIDAVPKPR
ncbi:TolC family protein [Gimesia algae]|uniref:Cobalt-zinc-cadmium resistance protein CzcC n=1 Tax=Gimesia algae TaxID=2527971 RepID=A0A517VKE8_9PLAN|nr:TolC family protein [Gimesia algae]QDT93430.1 Cobalt-zinc-cadmium resistance protein CzcC precursor [Gimesia algae]